MRMRAALLTCLAGAAALVVALTGPAPPATASATLTEITEFGPNPSDLRMHVYVPDTVEPRPAVVVAVHYCTGSGPEFYDGSGREFATLADRHGYIVIYPSATRSGGCFDVHSQEALRRGGGSDPVGIASMVDYVQRHYNAAPDRVFATGTSSGGMMTNVLLATYPDTFRAGAAFMGVPFGCFATTPPDTWNSECADGRITKTPQEWGDMVRDAFSGYSGPYPRMQIWHGTEDTTLRYPNFTEQIKQWTNVLGVSGAPVFTDTPRSGWTRARYGGTGPTAPVESISVQGVGHELPLNGMAAMTIDFFGLTDDPRPPFDGCPGNRPFGCPVTWPPGPR